MGRSERQKEIQRRRHRRQKLRKIVAKAETAAPSEKIELAQKVRALTPGANVIIERLQLEER